MASELICMCACTRYNTHTVIFWNSQRRWMPMQGLFAFNGATCGRNRRNLQLGGSSGSNWDSPTSSFALTPPFTPIEKDQHQPPSTTSAWTACLYHTGCWHATFLPNWEISSNPADAPSRLDFRELEADPHACCDHPVVPCGQAFSWGRVVTCLIGSS